MSPPNKLRERVIEQRLKIETQVTINQFGFMLERLTTKTIYFLQPVMEPYPKDKKDLDLVFIYIL